MEWEFRLGAVDEALNIMQEATEWTKKFTSRGLWAPAELDWNWLQTTFPTLTAQDVIVAYKNGKSAGACFIVDYDPKFWPNEPAGIAWYLHRLCVRREFSGQGLPDAIMDYAKGLARERGSKLFRLDTMKDNAKLCALYDRLGFTRCGETDLTLVDRDVTVQLFEMAI